MYRECIRNKYNELILADREYPEMLVMSCILNDLTFLQDFEFKETDFLSVEMNILFKIAKLLKEEEYTSATQLEIKGRLSEAEREFFKREEIWKMLSDFDEIANKENFSDYVDKLYKNNIYITLTDLGFDLFKEITVRGKNIVPFDLFRNMNSREVKEFFEYYINEFNTVDTNKGIEESTVDFSDEYIKSIYAGQTIGTLFDIGGYDIAGEEIVAFPTLSNQSNGLIEGSFSILSGYSNVGKSTWLIAMVMAVVHRGEKVVICSNEQRMKPFLDNFLMWILVNKLRYENLDKNKLRIGERAFSDEDKKMLDKAVEIWQNEYSGKILFISLPTAKMEYVQKKFREYYLRHGCTFFIYDTFKIDFSANTDRFYLNLVQDSRILAEFANRYNVKVFATMQNAINSQGQLWLDANVLSNSKQVKEVLQNLYIIRNMYKEEMDEESRFYCEPYTISYEEKLNGTKIKRVDKYIFNPDKDYRIIFIDKTREGRTSEQGNYAVVVEFDGAKGTMKEVCQCVPKRLNINAVQKNNSR